MVMMMMKIGVTGLAPSKRILRSSRSPEIVRKTYLSVSMMRSTNRYKMSIF